MGLSHKQERLFRTIKEIIEFWDETTDYGSNPKDIHSSANEAIIIEELRTTKFLVDNTYPSKEVHDDMLEGMKLILKAFRTQSEEEGECSLKKALLFAKKL